jgi:hypothetical protein
MGTFIMPVKTVTAAEQKRAAKLFTQLSCLAVAVPPLVVLWIAASIFVYASIAHHPNPRVVEFLRPAGHRFYGLVGALVVALNFSPQLAKWAGGWLPMALAIWGVAILVVVVPGIRDLIRADRENWQDMTVEVEHA